MDYEKNISLIEYVNGFNDFEKYIKQINLNHSYNFEKHYGYLINLEEYEKIKLSIKEEYNKTKYKNNYSNKSNTKEKKVYVIEDIEFRNSNYLLNMIQNGNKYIFININLWKLLCKKNKEETNQIEYEINYYKIKFKLDDQKELIFNNSKDNIINSYYKDEIPEFFLYKENFDKIANIYYKINEYYNFQKLFEISLGFKYSKSTDTGYLVNLNWFYKWDKLYNYSYIKSKYLEKNKNRKEIVDYLIYLEQFHKICENQLEEPELYYFSNKEEFYSCLKNNKLIMINPSLITFSTDFSDKLITFDLKDNKIEFSFGLQQTTIQVKDNIITLVSDSFDENPNLLTLIKIFYFRKFLRSQIIKEHKITNKNNPIVLVKKAIINKYIEQFDYKILYDFLSKNFAYVNYNNLSNNFGIIIKYIKENLTQYYKEFMKKENLLNFNTNEYYLIPQSVYYDLKPLTYISDFEIIDDDIFSFFLENKMVQNFQKIKGEYLAEEGKILLNYNFNSSSFYEIGVFDISNENFIPQYILEESSSHSKKIMEKFHFSGIKKLLTNVKDNKIQYEYNFICHCYDIRKIEVKNNDDMNKIDNQYNIIEIVSTLMMLNIFEKDIKKKIEISKTFINDLNSNTNPLEIIHCKLVNETFINKIKQLFDYQKIKFIIDNYQLDFNSEINAENVKRVLSQDENYKIFLLNKKNEFLELKKKGKEICSIEKQLNENEKEKFNYPLNFNVLEKKLFYHILSIFDLNEENLLVKQEDILLTFNFGNIVFRSLSENFCGNNMSLLYIYSLKEQPEIESINYFPEAILGFETSGDINKQLPGLIKENIMLYLLKGQSNYISIKYECKICLIFNANQNEEPNSKINSENLPNDASLKFLNKLLLYSFEFYNEYSNFYYSIKLFQKKNVEEKIYLINKKYIDELKSISQFDEFYRVWRTHPEIKGYLNNGDINSDQKFLDRLKQLLNPNNLNQFKKYNINDIEQRLGVTSLYDIPTRYIQNSPFNNLFYYENFQIINQQLYEIINNFDNQFAQKCKEVKGIFSFNKVILLLCENEKYIINVGQINNADEFELEYLLQNNNINYNKFNLNQIMNYIKQYGYNSLEAKIVNDEIIIKNSFNVRAQIYRISSGVNIINNFISTDSYISDKLKAMILLSISQINIDKFKEYNPPKLEKVYLMNYNYLTKHKYEEIISLLQENEDILKLVEEMNNPSCPYNTNNLDIILTKLDKNALNKIDQELQNIRSSQMNWEGTFDPIKLKNKKINVCKEFILVKKKIYEEIQIKLSLNPSSKEFFYMYNKGDIIVSNNYNEYYILFGNINNESHLFNLKYILDFDSASFLKEEIKIIKQNGIDYYMKEKAVFSEQNTKDLISPIFGDVNEIGYFYKYSPGINYKDTNEDDYSNYLRGNLEKVINLYNYYDELRQKKTQNYYESDKKYYLINKDIMNLIKKDYNYNIIIETLNKAQFKQNERNNKKKMLFILKNLPEEIYEDFIKAKKKGEMYEKEFVAPNQVSFTPQDYPDYSINIYDNFEIIESSIAKQFINDIYGLGYEHYMSNDENFIDCSFRDGKVIVYYTKSKFNNNKYVYEIGIFNEDYTFIPEYLIIYKKDHAHFESIKYKLNNYLKSLDQQFINGTYPITIESSSFFEEVQVDEIGKVVNLSNMSNQNIFQQGKKGMDIDYDYGKQNQSEIPKPGDSTKNKIKSKTQVSISKYLIKEYNLDKQSTTKEINSTYYIPPLIGLDNIGATCYMNATLQCLCNIPKLVNYFKYNKHLQEIVKNDLANGNKLLCTSFKLLIEKLWPDNYVNSYYSTYGTIGSNNTYLNKNNDSYAPKDFKTKISTKNDLFKGVAANDAKDLVNFLIMTLHEELNTADKKILNTNAINQDQRNQQLMFNLFTQDFVNNNKSIISDLFYGVNYNIVQCNGCMARSFNYQTYFFFDFPLEEIRIFKSQNNYNNNFNYNMNFNNNEVNIYDCFLYDQRINYMVGENAMFCNFCKRQCNSQMCTILAFGPEIIIIILNRGQGIQYKVKVNFDEQLNLYNFIEYKDTGVNYQLVGVVTHLGGSDMSGHFIAYCKNPISNTWYQYNDSIVNEVNQANFKAEVIDYAMPYLLFYQKVGK